MEDIRLSDLKVFVYVYKYCSITQAADSLLMEQSNVSRIIIALEKKLNVQLFERKNGRLFRTDNSTILNKFATDTLRSWDQVKESIHTGSRETIRIGCASAIGTVYAPGVVAEFQDKNKQVPCRLYVNSASELSELLLCNQLDFALITDGFTYDDNNEYSLIGKERMTAVMPNFYAKEMDVMTLKKFLELPLITRERGSGARACMERMLNRYDINAELMMECMDEIGVIEGVRSGLGVAIVPDFLADTYLKTGEIKKCRIIDDDLERKYYLVKRKTKMLTPEMRELIKRFEKAFQEKAQQYE